MVRLLRLYAAQEAKAYDAVCKCCSDGHLLPAPTAPLPALMELPLHAMTESL